MRRVGAFNVMKATIKRFMERRRRAGASGDPLDGLPRVPCAAERLRKTTERDLSLMFNSAELGAEWAEAGAALARACPIEDGKTDGVNPGDRRALWYLVRSFGPASVLEVGTHVGASTLHIASAMRSAARRDPLLRPRLVTVDIEDVNSEESGAWKKRGLSASPERMVEALGCPDLVTFVTEPSLSYLDRCEDRFDLIFLDGDHSAATVYQEVPRALRLLNEGGVILLHDYFPENVPLWSNGVVVPGPYTAVARLCGEGAGVKVIPLGSLPWETKLGSSTTSLALMTRTG